MKNGEQSFRLLWFLKMQNASVEYGENVSDPFLCIESKGCIADQLILSSAADCQTP